MSSCSSRRYQQLDNALSVYLFRHLSILAGRPLQCFPSTWIDAKAVDILSTTSFEDTRFIAMECCQCAQIHLHFESSRSRACVFGWLFNTSVVASFAAQSVVALFIVGSWLWYLSRDYSQRCLLLLFCYAL